MDDQHHMQQLQQSEEAAARQQPGVSTSSSSAKKDDDIARALHRIQSGALRGALIGLTLRGGLHAAGALLAALGGGRRAARGRPVGAAGAARDSLRYAAFLATLAATYIGADEAIARAFGKRRSAGWRALVAGVAAGPALLLTGPHSSNGLAVYVLLRGITLLVRTGNRSKSHPLLRKLLAPTRLEHGDTLLMCACTAQIIYAFIMHPNTLPPSYVRFIQKQGGKQQHVYAAIGELARRAAAGGPFDAPLETLAGTALASCGAGGSVPCPFFHPGQTCGEHAASIVPAAFRRALRVYLPVYLLPALLVHRKRLLSPPTAVPILLKAAAGVARSSAFLSLCIAAAFGGACLGHAAFGQTGPGVLVLSTWLGGLALLVEKKSRRMEIALYVLSRSLESLARCLVEWRVVAPRALPARLDVLIFALGAGAIMHCYSDGNGRHRGVFKSKYLNVLDFVFGSEGFGEGRISHAPSDEQLVAAVGMRLNRSFRSFSAANLVGLGGGGNSDGRPSSSGGGAGGGTRGASSSDGQNAHGGGRMQRLVGGAAADADAGAGDGGAPSGAAMPQRSRRSGSGGDGALPPLPPGPPVGSLQRRRSLSLSDAANLAQQQQPH